MKFSRSFLLKSMHSDWCICQGRNKRLHGSTDVQLDFYNGDPGVLERCTFSFEPIPQYENKYKNCRNVIGPVKHRFISGQPPPHPPELVPKTAPPAPNQPSCIPVCTTGNLGKIQREEKIASQIPSIPTVQSSQSTYISLLYFLR